MAFMRPLGNTGLTVSALGLGTVKIGRDKGVKYPNGFTIPDDRAVADLLARARDLGINLIDTAPAYGHSEARLGQLLHQRQDWVIVTKVGEEFDNDTGDSHFDFTPEHVQRSVERSLARLNTDYLDCVLVHSDGNDLEIIQHLGTLDALNALKQKGLIRTTGMSTKTVAGGIATLEKADVAMVTYNLAHDEEVPVIEHAARHGKGILIKKAFASGHLCHDGDDPVQQSLNRILGTDGVSSIIAGTINPRHLQENVSKARRACGE
ncbi:aldo/keto reductase [Alcanivorax hongdengensis A-11-3]|uniref:Aldo/keto reductase n=1 Tax=Alcanivorax hongdengensis A-11-3 TaxID=1177179 RepID=L0WG89_9GAMM|nr:aldo/keto reductase [Alcanivorax hongdengensis]EKF76021.1 aldo/keto reductase [Alcanivorax hongdengensis A-11-3]